MSARVAITRAEPGATATAHAIAALGATPIIAPLLTIEPRAFDASIAGAQALIFTSANAVRAFSGASSERDARVIAVGDHTAEMARAAGFSSVTSADGDLTALTGVTVAALSPAAGCVLHFSGDHIAGDLVGALKQAGFEAERRVIYNSVAVTELPAAFASSLDIIVFHSARAARTFVTLGAPQAERLTAACLSPIVAEAARGPAWKRMIVAPKPREDALLAAALTPQNT